jgi:hypothetical protein
LYCLPDGSALQFFTPAELAACWHLSEQTLANWRTAKKGPRFIRLGGDVRYPLAEVLRIEQEGQPSTAPKR